MAMTGYRVGIDIGGTFTDFVLMDAAGSITLYKHLTTPHDPAEGALNGFIQLLKLQNLSPSDVETLVHGTTLVTNAIIEARGAKTALLTTRGFRDILEMGREQRYDIYDLFLQYPEPYVPRRWRIEVNERMSRDGEVLEAPNLDEVEQQVAALVEQGVEAIAICLLHSYRNPAHERAIAERIRSVFPSLAISVSSEVVPEIREYERTSTTVANAYVQPLMDGYLERFSKALAEVGFKGQLHLMQSSGGLTAPDIARRFPIRLLESGPAGGALVTAFMGKQAGLDQLLAFDMGGTTAKACLIQDGKIAVAPSMEAARVHRFKRGSGIPIKAPVVDMIEIGAGGGSIARVDSLGLLKVGPTSAGAMPGPACYGRGGSEATVTDACLVLGYFDPNFFLGGKMALDLPAAEQALARLGEQLNMSHQEVAWGIHQIVCESMAAAARVHIIEQGRDPRRFPLMAFGGAGPAHAVQVARRLGVSEVIVPQASGAASALGFLVAPNSFELVRSFPAKLSECDWQAVNQLYGEMEEQVREVLAASGIAAEQIIFIRRAEMRFEGQFHDIDVPIPNGMLSQESTAQIEQAFVEEYTRLYGVVPPGYVSMVLNWRLHASGPLPIERLGRTASKLDASLTVEGALKKERLAYFAGRGYIPTPVYDRYLLPVGKPIVGPAIVEERESTTVIGPNDTLTVDEVGNLRIRLA